MSLAKKAKVNLPKDWIVVNSKSFADRVYYFNVRTGKSSWEDPRNDMNKSKTAAQSQKRKLSSDNEKDDILSDETVSKTPPKSSDRRLLCAHRSADVSKARETPQMKKISRKILERKEAKSKHREKQKSSQLKPETNNNAVNLKNGKSKRKRKLMPERNSAKSETKNRVSDPANISVVSSSTACPKSSISGSSDVTKNSRTQAERTVCSSPKSASVKKNSASKRLDRLKKKLTAERKKIEPLVNAKIKRRLSLQNSEVKEADPSTDFVHKNKLTGFKIPTRNTELLPSVPQHAVSRYKSLNAGLSLNSSFSNVRNNEAQESASASASEIFKTDKKPANRLAKNLPEEISAVSEEEALENRGEDLFCEEMEWEPIEEEKLVVEIQEVRMQISTDQIAVLKKFPDHTITGLELSHISENTDKRNLYIVVDTNVFLSNLKTVTDIIESGSVRRRFRPIIVVPWMVLQELDYIKNNRSKTKSQQLQKSAKTAVDTLFKYFSIKHPRLKGQTAGDAAANRDKVQLETADDEILQNCLQIRELGYAVVLLSNDKNLCNKAMINSISTYGKHESIQKILSLDDDDRRSEESERLVKIIENRVEIRDSKEVEISDDIFCEAKAIMKQFLSTILSKEMENLFGANWKKCTIIQPPWSITDVLKCVSNHWIAAIGDVFYKPAEFIFEKLSKMFLNSQKYGQSLKHVGEMLDLCDRLVRMVKSENYRQAMEKSSKDINELITTCNKKRGKSEDDNINEEARARKALTCFENIWMFTNNFCGAAADLSGISHAVTHENIDPSLTVETINQAQPELIFSLNRLIDSLRTALEEEDCLTSDHPALISLYQSLVNYSPNSDASNDAASFDISDLLCCIKVKKDVLKNGLAQLQQLCTKFCEILTFLSPTVTGS